MKLFLINFHFKLSSCCKLPTKIQLFALIMSVKACYVSPRCISLHSHLPQTYTHTLMLYLNDAVKCVTRFAKMSLPCTRHVAVRNVDWARKMCHRLGGIRIAAVHCTMRVLDRVAVYIVTCLFYSVSVIEKNSGKKSRNASMQPLPVAVHCHKEVVSGRANNNKKNTKRA